MKIQSTLSIVTLLVAAGCAHHEQQARYESTTQSSGYSATTSGGTSQGTTAGFAATTTPSEPSTTPSSTTAGDADRSLTMQIQQQINADASFSSLAPNIQINAQGGVVTLSGKVSSQDQKQRLEEFVKKTSGVVSVNNQLEISTQASIGQPGSPSVVSSETTADQASRAAPPSPTSDLNREQRDLNKESKSDIPSEPFPSPTSEEGKSSRTYPAPNATPAPGTTESLTSKVTGLTEADKTLGQQVMEQLRSDDAFATSMANIRLSVDNGKVTLRGHVKSEAEKTHFENKVKAITGVASVDNQLEVKSSEKSGEAKTEQQD